MNQTSVFTHLHRRARLLVFVGGLAVFVFFGSTIVVSYLTTLQGQRNRILEHEIPRLVRGTYDQVWGFFDPLSRSLNLLVSLGEWDVILHEAAADPGSFRRQAEEWTEIVGATDIALVDISREQVYAYWSGTPIQLDPSLERDAWFYETWAHPEPPGRKITFYYDENVGGRAFFYDFLLQDRLQRPVGVLGALVELEELALRVQRELSPGEFVYLVDADDQVLLEISHDFLREFFPVYTTTGVVVQDQTIPERYVEAARGPQQPTITADGKYAFGVFVLPGLDLTARVFLSTTERLEHLQTILFRNMLALLITFFLVIGGYLVLIGFYANRNTRQLQIIQRSRAQLDEIVSVLAHSLGNDLQILRSIVSRHSLEIQKDLDPPLLDMEQVLQNAIYSVQLADDSSPVLSQPLDVAGLRERLTSSCTVAMHTKGQTLVTSNRGADSGSVTQVYTDEDLVFHILLNLLSNAIKYSPSHSAIIVDDFLTDEALEFVVADQGPGFSSEDRRRLFRKYSRLSARPTQGERSTGVGLFVSARLAERLGGSLTLLDSLPSWAPEPAGPMGAVWLFHLPRNDNPVRTGR